MKPIKTVIFNHILSNPIFNTKLEKVKCLKKIKLIFELKLGINSQICNSISYMYKKQDTLMIAISHPAYAMELKYNFNKIIKLLNSNYEDNIIDIKECLKEYANTKRIKTFIPNFTSNKTPKNNSIYKERKYNKNDFYFQEKSKAIFVNNIENKDLRDKLESIRQTIKNNIKDNI